MKKINLKLILFFLIFFLIFFISYGALLKHHYKGGTKFKYLQNIVVFFAEIPSNIKLVLTKNYFHDDIIKPINEKINKEQEFFIKKLDSSRNELILISRYDGNLGRSIVEIRDLNNFDILHSYLPDIKKIYEKTDLTKNEFQNLKKDKGINKFNIWNPAITSKGELIFHNSSPITKIDLCGNIIWVNDKDKFHHSINLDLKENIYAPSRKFPYSQKISELVGDDYSNFEDDSINILNSNGETLFSKSVTEILIENDLKHRIFSQQDYKRDPINLNDIQPVLQDGKYFKKGDLFLSLRHLSMIILYRPGNNKIIKIIEGEFFHQNDVDIIDEKTISIYNNNVFINYNNERTVTNNEIIFYNFETDTFNKKFENSFKKLNIDTTRYGSVEFLSDKSAVVEDTNNGRIFYLNKDGDVVWEFNNINEKGLLYNLFWSSIIKGEKLIEIKEIIKNKDKICKK